MKIVSAFLGIITTLNLIAADLTDDQTIETTTLPEESVSSSETSQTMASAHPSILSEMPNITNPLTPPSFKSPFLAAALSSIMPGLGHAYLDDFATAGSILGTAFGFGLALRPKEGGSSLAYPVAESNIVYYSIYAAYRDARSHNNNTGYLYPMPTDTAADLALAPFNFRILKKPDVWGGIIGLLALGASINYLAFYDIVKGKLVEAKTTPKIAPWLAFPVGVGEEALYRGCLQPFFSETFSPWGGILLSSLLFGASHIGNAKVFLDPEHEWRYYAYTLPYITSMGAYFGWLSYKNHSLKETVAIHAWYDFTLFMVNSLASQSWIRGKPEFAFSFTF